MSITPAAEGGGGGLRVGPHAQSLEGVGGLGKDCPSQVCLAAVVRDFRLSDGGLSSNCNAQ
jgi:hypothetical protein